MSCLFASISKDAPDNLCNMKHKQVIVCTKYKRKKIQAKHLLKCTKFHKFISAFRTNNIIKLFEARKENIGENNSSNNTADEH